MLDKRRAGRTAYQDQLVQLTDRQVRISNGFINASDGALDERGDELLVLVSRNLEIEIDRFPIDRSYKLFGDAHCAGGGKLALGAFAGLHQSPACVAVCHQIEVILRKKILSHMLGK